MCDICKRGQDFDEFSQNEFSNYKGDRSITTSVYYSSVIILSHVYVWEMVWRFRLKKKKNVFQNIRIESTLAVYSATNF